MPSIDLARLVRPSAEPVPAEPDPVVRRRRVVVVGTLVVGTALLAATLAVPSGSDAFTALGLAVAATWVTGAALSGPLHLGRRGGTAAGGREVAGPVVLGALAYLVFLGASLVAREIPGLAGALESILGKADAGPLVVVLLVAVVNGVAEEVFFRGALHSAFGARNAAVRSTLVYVLVTVSTLNVVFVAVAAVMGTLFALECQAIRGVLAPVVTHVTWSTLMILLLPR